MRAAHGPIQIGVVPRKSVTVAAEVLSTP